MKLRHFLLVLAALGAFAASGRAAAKKPNIIFILGDDVGIGDISFSGADRCKTPNIDALAHGGTIFTHAYAEPLCGPSRATILTGRYVFRTGATNQDATGRFTPAAEIMMPTVLKSAGYVTAAIGKWGQLPLGPKEFGFDDYLKFKGSGVYWNTQDKGKDYELNGKTVPLRDKEYLPEVMHQHLIEFLTKHHDDPFYVYYSMSHIHTEILPTPDSKPGTTDIHDLYADNIRYMDKLVGKLVAELERMHLRENTLIIYFGDNGTANGEAPTATIGGRRLLGAKGSMLEGGSRVPLCINWPGVTPAGKVSNDLIDSSDFFPTFAALTGAQLPANRVIDGRSFLPQVRGEKGQPRDWVFVELARNWYVADQKWKLTEKHELFDLSDAPFAEKLVPADTSDLAAIAARQRLQAALTQLNPEGGFLDDGDGTGRHAGREENRAKRKKAKQE
jgi:arylsulfatase A